MTMAERVHDLPLAFWANNLEELDREIARLATLCQIRILEPGAIQRVLQKDASVCGTDNPIAFAKLRDLLMLHFAIRENRAAAQVLPGLVGTVAARVNAQTWIRRY